MTTSATRKGFSFARMMVLAQRRHEARIAQAQKPDDTPQRELALRHTLQKMNGTKRLLVFMYPA